VPIWGIAPIGVPIALLGGAAVGWAHHETRTRLASGVRGALALVLLLALTLVPGGIVAALWAPETLEGVDDLPGTRIGAYFGIFIALAAAVGAAEGWWLARSRKGAAVVSLASVAFAFGLGHNVPVLGGERAIAKMWAIMLVVMAVSAFVLAAAETRLGTGSPRPKR
jgi:hypothetical protein